MSDFLTDKDVDRLLSIEQADNGYFALALHGIIEKWLRKNFTSFGTDTRTDFGSLWKQYSEYIKRTVNLRSIDYSLLKNLKSNHHTVNGVRHNFEQLSNEETSAMVNIFIEFFKLNSVNLNENIYKLEKRLEWWKERKSIPELNKELKYAMSQITQLSKEKDSLFKEVKNLEELKEQHRELENQDAELKKLQKISENRKEKNDALRQKYNQQRIALQKEKRKLQDEINSLGAANEYLDQMIRFSAYTRTRLDFERRITRLTPEQQEIVSLYNPKHDYLIKGAAGTGKSLVLIKALEKTTKEQQSLNIRLLTFTRSLEHYNKYISEVMGIEVKEDSITTIDKTLYRYFRYFQPEKEIKYSGDRETVKLFESIMDNMDCRKYPELTAYIVAQEAERFIWANMITREDYIDKKISRKGMKIPLRKRQREFIWQIIENVEVLLKDAVFWPWNYAACVMLKSEENEEQKAFHSDYTFIDEVQDLPAVVVALMRKITKKSLFLAGDNDQSIFQKGMSLKRAGVDVVGRTRILHTNFRNTIQIHDIAENYRNCIYGKQFDSKPNAFRLGPPPELIEGKDLNELFVSIEESLEFFINYLSYEPENICIIAPRKDHLEKLKDNLMIHLELDSDMVNGKDFSFDQKGIVRLSTMQSCKGLDFPVVFLLLDHRPRFNCPYDVASEETIQRNLIYVSITRALEHLRVFTLQDAKAPMITDLTALMKAAE